MRSLSSSLLTVLLFVGILETVSAQNDDRTLRVFIFAGQSNMVGSDSKVKDIKRFPPFAGLEEPQQKVRFSYCIGRENKKMSDGWTSLQPVDGIVGPELSFARHVTQRIKAPVAIIKCAAGGTHLGGDWNPDEPTGFKMYPLALNRVRKALSELDRKKVKYRLEGFVWHQGENDMFEDAYLKNYGRNLKNFIASWRRDLNKADLRFYIGELCTKTIWGMDLRDKMHAVSVGQKEVCREDPLASYIPTSHVGVEIGGGVGLHYHYGTLGQLEHGVNYADAYLTTLGESQADKRPLKRWPYTRGSKISLFILAGHRNMEGERSFVQDIQKTRKRALLKDNPRIAFKYSLGGGYKNSDGWEPLGPAGYYDTFGPELSFGARLRKSFRGNVAIAKFTHSGSQIIDWTPDGSKAETRNLYPQFVAFIKESVKELKAKGHRVEIAGIFYHVGENDMSFGPYRKNAASRIGAVVTKLRKDLRNRKLLWFMSQQSPTDHESVNKIDVTSDLEALAASDKRLFHWKVQDLPEQEKQLVLDTRGVIALGDFLARSFLEIKKR